MVGYLIVEWHQLSKYIGTLESAGHGRVNSELVRGKSGVQCADAEVKLGLCWFSSVDISLQLGRGSIILNVPATPLNGVDGISRDISGTTEIHALHHHEKYGEAKLRQDRAKSNTIRTCVVHAYAKVT